ncbi:hematopoietic progenitor cell antigen CD34-like [Astyanax mexicanus]|nr:hematopoietic progenitor cell antigen CD34-like [Astyanax mexicanus]
MNEMWRRMALALFLCVLLFHSSHAEDPEDAADPTSTAPANVSTISPGSAQTAGAPQTDQTGATEQAKSSLATGESRTAPPSGKGSLIIVPSPDSGTSNLEPVPTTPQAKIMLGGESAMPEHGKSSPAVFVSLLVTGLVVAAALIGAYLWKNNRRTNSKGMKLANESVMADEENQGNTLVSVAPLNPPQEPQEKPSLNGESQEAVKPQNPPAATNGHSATKTADTEL